MKRIVQSILASIAVIVLVTACSGAPAGSGVATLEDPSASGQPSASPSASPMTPQDAALAYARCMRENGVDMPDPVVATGADGGVTIDQSGGAPVSKETFVAADTKCHHFMADAGPNGPREPISAEDLDKLLQFARCMREHGIDMPDPNGDGGIIVRGDASGGVTGGKGPKEDPGFEAANTACAHFLPGSMGKPNLQGSGPAPIDGKGGGSVTVPQ